MRLQKGKTMKEDKTRDRENPLVSICCLTYNHESFIRDALDGFLNQKTSFPFEIVIYDDASTDRTPDIIREYVRRFPGRFRPLLNVENQYSKGITNPSGAFNFPRARGKYIAMCEGDDYWTDPDKLQRQIDYLENHPDCTLCIHRARVLTVDGSRSDKWVRPYRRSRRISPEEIIDKSRGSATASMVFPARLVEEIPSYYTDCPVGDIPLHLMAAVQGYGYYMDRSMSVYRVGVASSWTTQGKTGDYAEKQRKYCEEMKLTYQTFDKATDRRFHEAVKSAAKRIWYLTKVNTRCYGVVTDKKYRNYFRELTWRTRFYICLELRFPKLYGWLAELAHRERRKKG